ncbi:MAG: DNA repair protein RecN [Bacteroidales bacterium]
MLARLHVQNYALIRELDITLGTGLTVITGETGAGKSILLGALSLVLGARADTGVLLDESLKCVVEGTFRINDYGFEDFFSSNELDYDPVTIIRREISPSGKSRAFINDTPVNLNVLKELGDKLIDVHSQHQTLMLNENNFQLNVIDSFSGNGDLRSDYARSYKLYRSLRAEHDSIKDKAEKNKADLEYYMFQLAQLDEAKLKPSENIDLEKEQELLEHAGDISSALQSSSELLSSEGNSIVSMLGEVKQNLLRIVDYYPEAASLHERVVSSFIELDDISREIDRMLGGIEADPERLQIVRERLDLINSLLHKHRVSDIDGLLEKQEEIRRLVNTIVTSDERLDELEKLLEKEKSVLLNFARKLNERRKESIPGVEKGIVELLQNLGMPNARFRIELTGMESPGPNGADRADFLFSANKQIPPENLSKVASGGELSRVMLSLKSVLSRSSNLPTIIFDEIDSGVSGEVADKVGQILSEMGKYMQVINITHLPQVASRGKEHYHVYKDDTEHSTITRVRLLTAEERVYEVARLLSGSEVTETAIQNARELIGSTSG